jgi:RND family efflux transporter MFP subunit
MGIGAALLLAIPALAYYFLAYAPAQTTTAEPEFQTSAVRQGDLILYASGSGTLIAGNQVELGFGTNGTLAELQVQAGDTVEVGEILAEQADREQLEAAVAADELALLEAQQALDELVASADLVAAQAQLSLANTHAAVDAAQTTWQSQQAGYRASSTTIRAAEAELALAKEAMAAAEAEAGNFSSDDPQYAQAYKDFAAAVQRYWKALANLNWYTGHPTDVQQAKLDAELALARAQLSEAERAYAQVQAGADPDQLASAELRVANAEAGLALSRRNLEQSVIVAPFAGTIMEVSAGVGDNVAGPFVTLADLSRPELEVFLDETDADKISVGDEVEVVFDAFPGTIYTGRVVQVDPKLNTQLGVATIKGRVQLDAGEVDGLLVGMNAAVDVIGGRAEGVLLVPVEALRELGPGEYSVFVVVDGDPQLRSVEVGLMDLTFAEIRSGLTAGEIVTTGVVETG